MVKPYDYSIDVPDPLQAFGESYALGAKIAQLQSAREAAQAESAIKQQQQQAAIRAQQEVDALYTNPNPLAADFARVSSLLPKDQAENVRKSWEILSDEKKKNSLAQSGQVFSALRANAPDIAIKLLEEQAVANRNAGREEEAKAAETYIRIINVDPKRAFDNIGTMLAVVPGGEKIIESAAKSAEMRRAEEMAPITMRKESAEAIGKEISNKFAPDKFAADLGLTQAQTEQAKASVAASRAAEKRSGAEAARALAEARQMGAGVIPLDKRPEAEAKFRKEYSDQTKGYQDVKSAYGRILAVSDPKSPDEEAAADLALIFNFMKMQDPGSTINSGEFANAQNAAGVPDRIKNMYNKLITGGRLNPSQRNAFKGQAKNLYEVAGQNEAIVRKGIERISTGYGLKTENIFYTPTEVPPTAPAAVPAAAPATAVPQPAQNRIDQLLKQYGSR